MKKIKIWQRETANTRPRGLGYAPTYHLTKPYVNNSEMIWANELTVELPDGYTVEETQSGEHFIFDSNGNYTELTDYNNKPALIVEGSQYPLTLKTVKDAE